MTSRTAAGLLALDDVVAQSRAWRRRVGSAGSTAGAFRKSPAVSRAQRGGLAGQVVIAAGFAGQPDRSRTAGFERALEERLERSHRSAVMALERAFSRALPSPTDAHRRPGETPVGGLLDGQPSAGLDEVRQLGVEGGETLQARSSWRMSMDAGSLTARPSSG
jgi:hypothetical protein